MTEVLTSENPEWIAITKKSRPRGKCLLLTCENVAVVGEYDGNPKHYKAYYPLPKLPKFLKKTL